MLSDAQREQIRPATRTMQIISGALVVGALMFLCVVVAMGPLDRPGNAAPSRFLTYALLGMAGLTILTRLIVPKIISGPLDQSIANDSVIPDLLGVYQTKLIVGSALLEGGAFMCTIAYMLERQPIALYAAIVMLALLAMQIPTVSRVENWIAGEIVTQRQFKHLR